MMATPKGYVSVGVALALEVRDSRIKFDDVGRIDLNQRFAVLTART
jgi:hypothetical protein